MLLPALDGVLVERDVKELDGTITRRDKKLVLMRLGPSSVIEGVRGVVPEDATCQLLPLAERGQLNQGERKREEGGKECTKYRSKEGRTERTISRPGCHWQSNPRHTVSHCPPDHSSH